MIMLLIIVLPLPVLTYSREHIRYAILWQILISFTFIFSFFHSLEILEVLGFTELPYVFIEERMVLFGLLGTLVFMVYMFYSMQFRSLELEDALMETNQVLRGKLALISNQRKKLTQQKSELMQVQEELHAIQDQLKARVDQKRKELRKQKEELSKYGFMNSHILRAPISRLKGLMQLNILTSSGMEKDEIIALMKESLKDLDMASQSINEILNNENPNKLQEIENRVQQIYGSNN